MVHRRFCDSVEVPFRRALQLPPPPAVLHLGVEGVRMAAVYQLFTTAVASSIATSGQSTTKRDIDPDLKGKPRKNAIRKAVRAEKRERERERVAAGRTS